MTAAGVRPAARLAPGSRPTTAFSDAVLTALGAVVDPDTDEAITGLGVVRAVTIENREVTVHLRLPRHPCSPDGAYLAVSDVHDALSAVPGVGGVRIVLDDPAPPPTGDGTASAAGGPVTDMSFDPDGSAERWATFRQRAHDAAVERCCRLMLQRGTWTAAELPQLELLDLPEGSTKSALVRRRRSLGLPVEPQSRVLVDERGRPMAQLDAALRLRLSRPSCGGSSCGRHLFARRT